MDIEFTAVDSSWSNASGLEVDELNAFEIGAAVTTAGIGVASIGLTTTVAPTLVALPGMVAGALALTGYHRRNGHLPFMGDKDTTPAPVAAVQPGAVVDTAGKPVEVEGL